MGNITNIKDLLGLYYIEFFKKSDKAELWLFKKHLTNLNVFDKSGSGIDMIEKLNMQKTDHLSDSQLKVLHKLILGLKNKNVDIIISDVKLTNCKLEIIENQEEEISNLKEDINGVKIQKFKLIKIFKNVQLKLIDFTIKDGADNEVIMSSNCDVELLSFRFLEKEDKLFIEEKDKYELGSI